MKKNAIIGLVAGVAVGWFFPSIVPGVPTIIVATELNRHVVNANEVAAASIAGVVGLVIGQWVL